MDPVNKEVADALFGEDTPYNSESLDTGGDSTVVGTGVSDTVAPVQAAETQGTEVGGGAKEAEAAETVDDTFDQGHTQDARASEAAEVASPVVGLDTGNPQVAFLLSQLAEARRAQSLMAMQGSQPNKEVSLETLVPGWEGAKSADDIEAILSSPENFNKFCTDLVRKAVSYGREVNLREMPRVVTTLVKDRETRQAELAGWYGQNQDLYALHEENALLATEIAGRNNQLSFSQILEEVGKVQRAKYSGVGIVGAKAPTAPFSPVAPAAYQPQTVQQTAVPAFGTPKSTRSPAPRKISKEEAELAELMGY